MLPMNIDDATRKAVLDQLLDVGACLAIAGCKRRRFKYLVSIGKLSPAKQLTNGDRLFWLHDVLRIRDEEQSVGVDHLSPK